MSKELFFINQPFHFKKGIEIYPPTVKDVVSNPDYGIFVKILTYSQEDIEDEFVETGTPLDKYPTPFEFLLNNCYHSPEYAEKTKQAFHFFIRKNIDFLYEAKMIIIGELQEVIKNIDSLDELIIIKEEDFFDFQNLIRMSCNKKTVEPPNPNEHPRLKAMKAKMRYRDRIKAKQGNGLSLFDSIASICCMGLGITPLNVGEMSYVAFNAIMDRYQEKEKYDIDIRTILAGGDSKKIKPKNWIRNLEN